MIIISLKQAKEQNLNRYFTGKPCKHGHIAERYLKGNACVECFRSIYVNKDKKAYSKEYREKNKAYFKDYFKANRVELLSKQKNYRKLNSDRIKLLKKRWREKNEERIKAYNKEYHKNYIAKHSTSYGKKYRQENKEKINAKNAKRRARKLLAVPKWADLERVKQIYQNCPEGYHVDHIIPLNNELVCGLHVENNLQYLTAEQNIRKGNKIENI